METSAHIDQQLVLQDAPAGQLVSDDWMKTETLAKLFDAMPDFGFAKDAQGRYVRVNLSLCNLLGRERKDVIGRTDHELYPPELAGQFVAYDEQVRISGQQVREECRFVLPDGRELFVESLKIPLYGTHGEFVGVLGMARDISERVCRARELEEARRAAESAARAKSQFLANMSHEIRTPLNGIIGLAHVVLGDALPSRQRGRLERLLSTSQLLLGQLNDLLDLAKIDFGKMDLSETGFSVGELFERLSDSFADRFRKKGLSLQLHAGPLAGQHVLGDVLRIEQVLTNFVGNALKFTEVGGVVVSVMDQSADGASDRMCLRFEVRDSGPGISVEGQRCLFQPFEQLDKSTTRKYGGSGLGLAICSGLAELMAGEVGLVSDVGEGSAFWLTVPVSRLSGAVVQPVAVTSSLAGLRVLLAEDNELSRDVGRLLLERVGAEVCTSADGREAVETVRASLRGERFDCVLMDMQMPHMDGIEAARAIRQIAEADALPIIAMTANVTTSDREACLAAGMDAFVGKPFDPQTLFAQIAEAVAEGRVIVRESGP